MNAVAKPNRPRFEHRYFIAAAVGVIVVVLAGFSIDLPLLSNLSSVSVLVRMHGVAMLTWIALFFTQALLVARHRVGLHMRLGIFGAVLALLVVVFGVFTITVAVRLGGHHMPSGMSRPLFLASGYLDLTLFAGLVGSALALRLRHSDAHKRLMLLATILLLDAALARFIGVYTNWTVDSSTVRNLLMLFCVVVDTVRCRRLHPAFIVGGALLLADPFIAAWLAGTDLWTHFTAWVIR